MTVTKIARSGIVAAWVALVAALPAHAQVDQQNTTGTTVSGIVNSLGQSFTPTLGGIDYATFLLGTPDASATFRVDLYQGNANGYTGTLLGSSASVTFSGATQTAKTFSFANTIGLTPGNPYTLRLVPTTGTFTALYSSTNPYAGGTAFGNTGSAAATVDLRFVEGLNVAAAPEPATWGLMILGFGLTGAALRRRGLAVPHPA